MSDNFLVGVEFQFKLKSNEAKKCEEFDDVRARTIYIQYKRPTTLTHHANNCRNGPERPYQIAYNELPSWLKRVCLSLSSIYLFID